MQQVDIPEYIDALPQVLLWEMDEVGPILVFIYGAMMTRDVRMFFVAILVSWVFLKVYRKLKGNQLDGYLGHLLYTTGLVPLNKAFTNGLITEFCE